LNGFAAVPELRPDVAILDVAILDVAILDVGLPKMNGFQLTG